MKGRFGLNRVLVVILRGCVGPGVKLRKGSPGPIYPLYTSVLATAQHEYGCRAGRSELLRLGKVSGAVGILSDFSAG